jgi:hypothetical protein
MEGWKGGVDPGWSGLRACLAMRDRDNTPYNDTSGDQTLAKMLLGKQSAPDESADQGADFASRSNLTDRAIVIATRMRI